MDPITLALLGGSMASSIFGGMASNDAAELNNQISLLNYYDQQAANQRQRQEAVQQRSDARLGQTDAAGNRTYFIPGVGWVTDLSEDQQQIQDMSEEEQIRQLSQGARDEQVQERAVSRRGREDTGATEADRDFRAQRREDPGALRQLLLARGQTERNAQADRAGDASARAAIRGGGTNVAAVKQGARAEADADSARRAGVDAQLQSRDEVERRFGGRRDDAAGLYDYFRKMSTSGTGNSQIFQPQGPQRSSTGLADQLAGNAAGQTAQFDYQQPNYALAGTISDMTQAGGAFYDRNNSQKYNQAMLDAFGRVGR